MSTTGGVRGVLNQLFTLTGPVDRRTYLQVGVALLALKYALDALVVYAWLREPWSPSRYLLLSWSDSLPEAASTQPALYLVLAAIALPFAWIGIAMTMRRCRDAAVPAALSLLFFVPFAKYLMIATLCALPSQPPPVLVDAQAERGREHALLFGVVSGVFVLVLAMAFSTLLLESYGSALFIGAPFASGFVAAFTLLKRKPAATLAQCLGVATLAVVAAGTAFLLIAWEGVVCMIMAAPIAIAFASIGAIAGRMCARPAMNASPVLVLLALWPLLTAAEASVARPRLREVLSVIEVDRAPSRVWPHVIAFASLPAPTEWLFKTGIAYPVRARIEGQGVGAVRYCEFSTGAFVEPITVWDAPYRLGFSVTQQPRPMDELTPYDDVLAPHLDSSLRSRRGEFLLAPLPGGRTRIEARTWYTLDMYPSAYWQKWSDAIIHRIHLRVLEHVRTQAQGSQPAAASRRLDR